MTEPALDFAATELTPSWADALAEQVLSVIHRPFPNKIAHVLQIDTEAMPPRQLTPSFWGAFDWHSAVHGHWSLVRLLNSQSSTPTTEMGHSRTWRARAEAALDLAFAPSSLVGEVAYVESGGRSGFELPYGAAWLLALDAAVAELEHPKAESWRAALAPLVAGTKRRFLSWLTRLTHPVRTGEHSQSAFAMGLALDAARATGDDDLAVLIAATAIELHGKDIDLAMHLEPSAFDFLSPTLAVVDLMRRQFGRSAFAAWLDRAAPTLGRDYELAPVTTSDPADGKLVHFDGLNLSRAWMLRRIAEALPTDDTRIESLEAAASSHAQRGLAAAITPHFAGSHWLGTFALMWLRRSGVNR